MSVIEKLKSLYSLSFMDNEEYVNYLFENIYNEKTVRYSETKNQITSAVYFLPRSFYFGEKLHGGAFLSGVSTSEAMRGKCVMKEVMRSVISYLSHRPISMIFLSPKNEAFYKSQGFCTILNAKIANIEPREPFFDLKEVKNYEEFHFLKMENISEKDVTTLRSKHFSRKFFELMQKDGSRVYKVYDGKRYIGYFVDDRDGIYEYSIPTYDIPRIKSSSNDWFIFGEGESFTMARLIDPTLFFSGLKCGVDFDISLEIIDEFLERTQRIRLQARNGITTCVESDSADVSLSVEELTLWAFGLLKKQGLPEVDFVSKDGKISISDRYL